MPNYQQGTLPIFSQMRERLQEIRDLAVEARSQVADVAQGLKVRHAELSDPEASREAPEAAPQTAVTGLAGAAGTGVGASRVDGSQSGSEGSA